MNRLVDPRSLLVRVGAEQMLMPAEGQWDDAWLSTHAFVLSPLTITRSRQGSLGDPDASQCQCRILVPTTAVSTTPVPVAAPAALGGATLAAGVAWDGDVWDRVRTGSTGTSSNGYGAARYRAALDDLTDGATYLVSAEVGNNTASAVRASIDWCDLPASRTVVTIPPGGRAVLTTTQMRNPHTATLRFVDVTCETATADILVRDVSVVPAAGVSPFSKSGGAPPLGAPVRVGHAGRLLFAGSVESLTTQERVIRLTDGTTLDALRIDVAAAGVLRILARTRIGWAPDDLPDATGNTVGHRMGQISQAVEAASGLKILWDRLAPALPTSWVADRDVDSQPALGVIMDTVGLADRVVVERGFDYSVVRRDAVTQEPFDFYTVAPYVRDAADIVVVPASAVPTPTWVLDAEGLVTQASFGFVDETKAPDAIVPTDTNQPVGDPVGIFDQDGNLVGWSRPEWLERTERTETVDHPTAGQDYGVSTWAVRGDALRTIRQFGASTPPGGPGNAQLRGARVAHLAAPRWRPDGEVPLRLDDLAPGTFDPVLYGHEPPFGYPLLTITDAPPGREHWRVVGATVALGHADDEAVTLALEHPSTGLPVGVRWTEIDPLVTIAATQAPGWTWLDCTDARTIQSGTVLAPPGTPTNLAPSRVSDTTTRLTWSTTGGPATSVTVEEQVNGSATWTRSALITAGAGLAEVATAADRSVVYRVTLSNPAGSSGTSAPSVPIRTRPNILGGVGWRWAGKDIVGTWLLDTAIPPGQYTIQVYRGVVAGGTYTWDAGPTHPTGQAFAELPGGTAGYTYRNAARPPSGAYCWAVIAGVRVTDGAAWLRSSYYVIGTADEIT